MSAESERREALETAARAMQRSYELEQKLEAAEARVSALERERDDWLRQRWGYQNRAEVAERGHKAVSARDFEQRDEIKALRARVAALTQEKEQFRIEADCGLRDYDALELAAGLMREALQKIADGRANRAFGQCARGTDRAA